MGEEVKNLKQTALGEEFLEHFGIKGMRWGVRRSKTVLEKEGPSDDYQRAAEAKAKLKKSGAQALTNKEMQDLVNRMNLEKQLSTLSVTQKDKYKSMVEKNLDQAMNKGMKQAVDFGVKFAFQKLITDKIENNKKQKQLSMWGGK